MKIFYKCLMVGCMVAGLTSASQARVRVWLGITPFVIAAPPVVVVAQPAPVVVADPYVAPPPDYRVVLDNFHKRVQRLQRLLDRQLSRRIISQGQYDQHADDLDRILRDEQADAAHHNGALTPREVNDLNNRLTELQDRVHEDLAR